MTNGNETILLTKLEISLAFDRSRDIFAASIFDNARSIAPISGERRLQ